MAAHWLRIDSSDVPGAVRGLGTGLAEPSPSWGFYSRAGAGGQSVYNQATAIDQLRTVRSVLEKIKQGDGI